MVSNDSLSFQGKCKDSLLELGNDLKFYTNNNILDVIGEYDILLNSDKQIFQFIKMIVLEYHVIPNHQVDELEKFLGEQGY